MFNLCWFIPFIIIVCFEVGYITLVVLKSVGDQQDDFPLVVMVLLFLAGPSHQQDSPEGSVNILTNLIYFKIVIQNPMLFYNQHVSYQSNISDVICFYS